jgi:low affinity Fe/Cu permease
MFRKVDAVFSYAAQWVSYHCGRSYAFVLACIVIIAWLVTGPYFQYSDTWQLLINTGTTIVTFLMVFLLQNTQTRDTMALQAKIDELILANRHASNALLGIEELPEEKIREIKETYARLPVSPIERKEK